MTDDLRIAKKNEHVGNLNQTLGKLLEWLET
jgi:hypothetical protein